MEYIAKLIIKKDGKAILFSLCEHIISFILTGQIQVVIFLY